MAEILQLKNIVARYGQIEVLHGVSLSIQAGQIVTLIGANGAGKTTTLKVISGILRRSGGSIRYDGKEISDWPPHRIVEVGISHVPEGRMVFANLTVYDNLMLGAYLKRDRAEIAKDVDLVYSLFPRLGERKKQAAGTLSGGEQQMLAIGRALMNRPRLLMLDEPSLGIAPLLVETIFRKIAEISRTHGVTVLLVEQNANLALAISQQAYVLETGRIILSDSSAALRNNPQVQSAYLGG